MEEEGFGGGGGGGRIRRPLTDAAAVPPPQILSWYPRIVLFPRFLDDAKCDHVVEIGKKRLHSSGLVLRKGETTEGTRDIRTRCHCRGVPLCFRSWPCGPGSP